MMLGDLLGRAAAAASALPAPLADEIAARGEPPGAFARQAVARFERHASSEDWTRLVSRVRDAQDPGTVCLEVMVRWSLERLPPGAPPGEITP